MDACLGQVPALGRGGNSEVKSKPHPCHWASTGAGLNLSFSHQVRPHDPCHCLNGHECEQTQGDSKGQGSLACCSPRGCKELATTEQLIDNMVNVPLASHSLLGVRRTVIITTSIFVMKPL